jgi:hypothetical protein
MLLVRIPRSENWDSRIEVLEEQPFFRNIMKRLDFRMQVGAFMSDTLKMQYLIRLKLLKAACHR